MNKKIIILIMAMFTLLSSCITIEKRPVNQIKDTTIIKEVPVVIGNNNPKTTTNNQTTNDLSNKTNREILNSKESIQKVFDRNDRKYNENLRGIWIASVGNIDYPSRPGESIDELKREWINLLDRIQKIGINAVFYQVKPGADAMYESKFWPTSRYLTGLEGKSLGYDILPFMINETHKRNIEFHAWINPYRASTVNDMSKISSMSVVKTHPDWTFEYNNQIWLNPGNPEVVDYVSKSIEEIVKKYDVDGIHLDDYFYPYPVKGNIILDYPEYQEYGKNFSTIDDWRRNNVDEMIKNLSVSVHKIKPNIVFGVSPFGIWKNKTPYIPNGSNTLGLQSYSDLYANSILWMEKGWIDYIAPQLYWYIGQNGSDYKEVAKWWNDEALRTHTILYTGNGIYKYTKGENNYWTNMNEIKDQLEFNKTLKGVKGFILYRYGTLLQHPFIMNLIK